MSTRTHPVDERLSDYLHELATQREDPLLAELRAETAELPMARMQISVEQGLFMGMLARILCVRRALEVGVFTGYSYLESTILDTRDKSILGKHLQNTPRNNFTLWTTYDLTPRWTVGGAPPNCTGLAQTRTVPFGVGDSRR